MQKRTCENPGCGKDISHKASIARFCRPPCANRKRLLDLGKIRKPEYRFAFCVLCYIKINDRNGKAKYCKTCGKKVSAQRCFIKHRKKKGIPMDQRKIEHRGWHYTKKGYKLLSGKHSHPNAQKNGRIMEHIFIWSQHFGRPLKKGENIHHRNGIVDDNRIENLELWSSVQPSGQRVEDKISWAKELLSQYGFKIIRKPKAESPSDQLCLAF